MQINSEFLTENVDDPNLKKRDVTEVHTQEILPKNGNPTQADTKKIPSWAKNIFRGVAIGVLGVLAIGLLPLTILGACIWSKGMDIEARKDETQAKNLQYLGIALALPAAGIVKIVMNT